MRDAFELPIREFDERLAAIARLERWRRGEDNTVEGRVASSVERFMREAARGR